MAVVRVEKTKDYTVMGNYHLKEKNMSLKAKGLLSLMLSLPDEWDYSIKGLETLSSDGNTNIRNALIELEEFKYLKREAVREKGKIVDWQYTIYEQPYVELPHVVSQQLVTPQLVSPQVAPPHVVSQTQLNTNILNTNIPSTKESKTKKEKIEEEFETIWKLYPRNQGKTKALEHYKKARTRKDNPATYEEVLNGVKSYNEYIKHEGTEQRFIKHGSTWFNQECWCDDYTIEPQKGTKEEKKSEWNITAFDI